MLISLTVGKVDAGVAVLLTEDKRLIEFPSILLPPSISSGSIVDITVARNHGSEAAAHESFSKLQGDIFSTYGTRSPTTPILRCRNATQTAVVLEWDPIDLATAELRSLSLYRNGAKAGRIPRPLEQTSTKLSGLAIDQQYTFHLVLRTSAGIYASEKLQVRTHKMTELSGITVTPGPLPPQLRSSLATAVERIGAKMIDQVRIDTTHFVCIDGRGKEWERAVENNIPVVRPEWIEGCEREGRIVGVRGYYLNADPKLRQVGSSVVGGPSPGQQQQQQQQSPRPEGQGTPRPEGSPAPPQDEAYGERPVVPEKDPGQRPTASRAASAKSVPQATEAGEKTPTQPRVESEEDSEEEDGPMTARKVDGEMDLPHRQKQAEEEDEAEEKEASDAGSMEDVAL